MDKLAQAIGVVVTLFLTLAIVAVLTAFPVKWLWNYAAVDVLHASPIDFWHALAMSFLCSCLFKGSSASK